MYDTPRYHNERTTYHKANEQLISPELAGTVTTQKQLRDFTDLARHSDTQTVFESAMEIALDDYFNDAEEDGDDPIKTNNITNIQEYIRWRRDLLTDEADPYDEDDFYLQELGWLEEFAPYAQLLQDTQAIIVKGIEQPDNRDSRQQFINGMYQKYVASTNDSGTGRRILDGDTPSLVDFVKYYHETLETTTVQGQFTEKIQDWRDKYATFLREKGTAYGSPASIKRAISAIETVPIIIDDPLSTLSRLMHDDEFGELFGVHRPDQRTVSVDPFTIAKYTTDELHIAQLVLDTPISDDTIQHHIDLQLRKTLLHELVHSFTNTRYYDLVTTWTSDDPDLQPMESRELYTGLQWQKFWREGMTEKIAVLHLGEQLGSDTASYGLFNYDREVVMREARDGRYPTQQTIQSERTAELGQGIQSSYSDYRTLIDAMFLKLDWQQAGLSQQEAEQLAVTAFLEVPDDTAGNSQVGARQAFIAAINAAAHPGFFMKLGHLVDHYGAHLSTVMLASDRFDPHDPAATPFVATKAYKAHATLRAEVLDTEVNKYGRMPEEFLAMRTEMRDSALARSVLLRDAIVGQGSILDAKYNNSKETNLFRAIFGEDLSHHYDALDKWQQSLQRRQ